MKNMIPKKLLLLFVAVLATGSHLILANNNTKDTGIPQAFYLSFAEPQVPEGIKQEPLFGDGPAIGKYGQQVGPDEQQYNFLQTLLLLKHKPDAIRQAPDTLINALLKQLGKQAMKNKNESVDFLTQNASIEFYTILWGSPFLEKPADRVYNLVFHPVVRNWLKGTQQDLTNFSVKVPMGIFEPKGIKPLSVQTNDLRAEDVVIHPAGTDVAFSPNNVTFQIEPGRNLVGFWSAAISPDKKHIVVVYNAIVDDNDLENKFSTIMGSSYQLSSLLDQLLSLAFRGPAQDVLTQIINNVINSTDK